MKRYFFAMLYFIIASLLLAAILINIPLSLMQVMQGKTGILDTLQSIILTPIMGLVAGGLLAGIPVAITGLFMEFYRRFIPNLFLFLFATLLTALLLELGYCQLLNMFKPNLVYKILAVIAFVTVIISFVWWKYSPSWEFLENDRFY